MQRLIFSLLAGGIFGAGLLISGMTDTIKVQAWLDVFGDWDATLAFVMGGAILPMAVAWRIAAHQSAPVLGGSFPEAPKRDVGPNLVIGSVLFGMGWALAGLCPGPALASIGYGGWGGLVFLLAMSAGMLAAPMVRARIDAAAPLVARHIVAHPLVTRPLVTRRSKMDIRALTPTYAVSPQIDLSDLTAIKAAGYTTVIDNRPDGEIPAHLHTPHMQAAAESLGLRFVANPVIGGALTMENVAVQAQAMAEATGPVFAYCASGNRCSVVWALMSAKDRPADELIGIPAQHGYNLGHLRDQIDALAKG